MQANEQINCKSPQVSFSQISLFRVAPHHNLGWVLLNIRSQDGHVENFKEMWSAYRKATELYAQQQKYALAQGIKQAFQVVGVEL